jgi:hypothetical protein
LERDEHAAFTHETQHSSVAVMRPPVVIHTWTLPAAAYPGLTR